MKDCTISIRTIRGLPVPNSPLNQCKHWISHSRVIILFKIWISISHQSMCLNFLSMENMEFMLMPMIQTIITWDALMFSFTWNKCIKHILCTALCLSIFRFSYQSASACNTFFDWIQSCYQQTKVDFLKPFFSIPIYPT